MMEDFDQYKSVLVVKDSVFSTYVYTGNDIMVYLFYKQVQRLHSQAAHVPYLVVSLQERKEGKGEKKDITKRFASESNGGEPQNCALLALKAAVKRELGKEEGDDFDDSGFAATDPRSYWQDVVGDHQYLLVIVCRDFGGTLLGLENLKTLYFTSACRALLKYVTRLMTLHFPLIPLQRPVEEISGKNSRIGLGAGDSALVLNFLDVQTASELFHFMFPLHLKVKGKGGLKYEEMMKTGKGKTTVLPRLQHLQGTVEEKTGIFPVYRYPGNEVPTRYPTHPWIHFIKTVVDKAATLTAKTISQKKKPMQVTFNHLVANYYRDGSNFIGPHSDKDQDIRKDSFIVSISLGAERLLRLRSYDSGLTQDILLPHGSLFILGPRTNVLFSHSIVKTTNPVGPRISLTLRDIATFYRPLSRTLFGQGVKKEGKKEKEEEEEEEYTPDGPLARRIAAVTPYYPFKGIDRFYDIGGFLAKPVIFQELINVLAARYRKMDIDTIGGFDARGFVLGPPLALALQKPFFMLRKLGKMPNAVHGVRYSKEYKSAPGDDVLCIQRNALKKGDRVLLIDDLVATGGTLLAGIALCARFLATVVECACVVEIKALGARAKFAVDDVAKDVPIWALCSEKILNVAGEVVLEKDQENTK